MDHEPNLVRFESLVGERMGFKFDDAGRQELRAVLSRRLAATGLTVDAYLGRLAGDGVDGRKELTRLAELLTVGETFFFRHPDQFRAFAEVAVPERMRARAEERRLRILSAGCATGEEPYSLAMMLLESASGLSGWDVEILGVDINPLLLARAREARYEEWSLRGASEERLRRHFVPTGKGYRVRPEVRALVTFREANLVDGGGDLWHPDTYDIIFCRNMTIYFSPEATRGLVERIRTSLAPGGFLFLGPAETLRGISQDFQLLHTHEAFYYQKRLPGAAQVAKPTIRGPSRVTPASPIPETRPGDEGWMVEINRAAERIAHLGRGSARPGRGARARGWDLTLATELLRQERFDDAMDALAALPAESEHDTDVQLLRAVVLTTAGRVVEAQEVCGRILQKDDLNAPAHYLMALCKEHCSEPVAAVEHDQTAIYLDPTFAMPHLHMGLLATRAGDAETALVELRKALALLEKEDPSRILLFGGGFSREALAQLCRAALRRLGGDA